VPKVSYRFSIGEFFDTTNEILRITLPTMFQSRLKGETSRPGADLAPARQSIDKHVWVENFGPQVPEKYAHVHFGRRYGVGETSGPGGQSAQNGPGGCGFGETW